ncbi:uncharacterized protein BP01DRAFT_374459 [Aspergillus saccharolyticus JOP 1030-1]|uniref:FAD/NAD(P)-binding domain-containing protein n=1 Tax=Aspergillus saccharolyticus JOP 1030-1 TaxID=1450539 RepID=A0A318ZBE5_9EURO|nr:hypothetical protein BP01DRAFT_374459 [Aspergillus saccharolyticus JOP 1030-1]PYH44765.1 hypothetical protein BP01DRAFT_374459 [Aspergillus saccharolyticus JOP 1030-1]
MGSVNPRNPVFETYNIPASVLRLGSNSAGSHSASSTRPVHHPEWDISSDCGYTVSNHLINEPPLDHKTFKVIVLGAGTAGIDFLHYAPQLSMPWAFSVAYTFPWRSNPRWTNFYSGAKEISEYMKCIVEEEGMMRYIRLRTAVTSAVWKWIVRLQRSDENGHAEEEWEEECDILINGGGFLNTRKWPDTPGLHSFQGKLFHTAAYPENLTSRTRSPVFITAAFGQSFAGADGRNFEYIFEQKENFGLDPQKYHRYKKAVENELNQRIKLVLRDTAEADAANAVRNGFLEALASEKTTVFTSPIKEITSWGFIDSVTGVEYEVDVIICATGFDTFYRPRFPIIGLDGVNLADKWSDTPTSYLAVAVDGFPNYFTYSGPFAPIGHGSILAIITHITHYFIQIIQRMRKQHICRQVLKLPRWFKQGRQDGPVVVWPGSRLAYFELLRTPTLRDFEIAYWSGNRFGYLGSGFMDVEFPSGEHDLTWYLDWYTGNEEWKQKGMKLEKEENDKSKRLSERAPY